MIGSGTPSSQSNAPRPKPMICLPLSVRIGRTTAADVPARPPKIFNQAVGTARPSAWFSCENWLNTDEEP
jgi:hypothetical protein